MKEPIIASLFLAQILEYVTLYHFIFWSLGALHLRAGLAYVLNPEKKDTYLSSGYSIGMTKDLGAHLWWLGCMLIAVGFVESLTGQMYSAILLVIGLIVPIVAEYQNVKANLQSKETYPRIILKCIYIGLCVYYIVRLLTFY